MTSPIQPENKTTALLDIPTPPLPSIASVGTDSFETIWQSLAYLTPEKLTQWANSKNEKGMTSLAVATEAHTPLTNKMDVIAFLVMICNADPNIGDNDNWTPLYRASTGTRSDALQLLLNHGANVNIQNKDGSTPLHRAVDRGSAVDVQNLLRHYADVNMVNCFGTPLSYAAKNGDIAIANILLDAGADPNLVNDPLGCTPVELAANNQKEDMKQLLLSRQGLATIPSDSKVHTSLSRLVNEASEEAILQSFVDEELDQYERSAAHYCAYFGKVNLLEQMCSKGNIDLPDIGGRTPLHYAIIKGQEPTVSYLMSNEGRCSLDSQDHQGYAPLMWACQYNQTNIARDVLERAKERNKLDSILAISDHFGWKAIHKSAQVGNVNLVRLLIEEYKIDHTQLTKDGRSPLDLAQATNAIGVIDYLRSLTPSLSEVINKV